jgi:hypothetical protein
VCLEHSTNCEWLYEGGSPTNIPGCFKKFSIQVEWTRRYFIPKILRDAVKHAVLRWQKIVLGQPGFGLALSNSVFCGGLFTIVQDTRIEDMLIIIDYRSIDGPKGAVAASTPCALWNTGTTAVAYMRVDLDDVSTWIKRKLSKALLNNVITHEMGHCFGFGSLWRIPAALVDSTGVPSRDLLSVDSTEYLGLGGNYGYNLLLQQQQQPYTNPSLRYDHPQVETGYGTGSSRVHWSEAVYGIELMTPFLEVYGPMPLSAMTAYSLQDLGYELRPFVDYEPYIIKKGRTESPTKKVAVVGRRRFLRVSSYDNYDVGQHNNEQMNVEDMEYGVFRDEELKYKVRVIRRVGLDL